MNNFLTPFSQFHFLRPDWFWLLLPLLIFWLLKLKMISSTQWHQVIPPHLANAMLGNNKQNKVKQKRWFVPFIWLLSVCALAGPTWQKIEKPVFQVKRASVIVLDMSMSMRATDIKPNRLSKARYKAIDLANAITDGEVALVAYAGDAFTISPLTPDSRNIVALIPSLKPEIMPVQGSYPLLGLTKATELLQQAGYPTGDIYWITDGVDDEDVADLNEFAAQTPYRVNVMTVGTSAGAPIKMLDNSLLKDSFGSIVIPKLNSRILMSFSNMSNGVFVNSTATDADIKTLLAANVSRPQNQQQDPESTEDNSLTGDDWQEFGPYLVLLILPLFLTFFRKGAGILLVLFLPFTFTPHSALASLSNAQQSNSHQPRAQQPSQQVKSENNNEIKPNSWTDFVFNTQDQVGAKHFNQQEFAQAQQAFEDARWKGAAAYKAGEYESALSYFEQDSSAAGLYNQSNALANLGKIDEAIEAIGKSLKLEPNNENAVANRAILEQIKQQQDQQKQDGDQQNQDGEQQDQEGGQEQDSQDKQSEQDSNEDSNSESEQSSDKQESDKENENSKNSESSNSQSDQPLEPTESENQQTPEQQAGEPTDEQPEESESKPAAEQAAEDKAKEEAQTSAAELSQEQIEDQEQQQKLQQLLRKVSDDPATLLRNKMILESKKRQQNSRSPKGVTKSW